MAEHFELLIVNGTLVDGTGGPPREGLDLAVKDGKIAAIGADLGTADRVIDAEGKLVTPGFVDLHTHYDGQITWDQTLLPSPWHGVTTVILGNCGVGFAPAAPDRRDWLIQLMEGVEDIPADVLSAGMVWNFETFPEYLDALEAQPRTVDVVTQIAHGPVRAYVMGERGASNEAATEDDNQKMADLVEEAVRAGALGFTTSRTRVHLASDGECVPGTFADADELLALGRGMARGGRSVFEVASDFGMGGADGEFSDDPEWMSKLSVETGMPVFYLLNQVDRAPKQWEEVLDRIAAVNEQTGSNLVAMTAVRPPGVLMGIEGSMHPFAMHPTFQDLADRLPLAELVAELRRPEVKAKILAEKTTYNEEVPFFYDIVHGFDKVFPLGDPPNYEPAPDDSMAARAAREGRDPYEYTYEEMLKRDGKALLFMAVSEFSDGTLDVLYDRLKRDDCVVSLSDAGAHARSICDASTSTYLLTHWARDRTRGPKFTIQEAVRMQTSKTAALYGLDDRGVLAPGYRADINIIDFDELTLHEPRMVYDLPGEGARLLQKVDGYIATIVAGEVIFEAGVHTGALPGRLVRGPQSAPVPA